MRHPCFDHGFDHGFLASSEILESVLLPLLSARDLFKLSCTSKGMQKWLLGTSSHLWQVSKVLCLCASGRTLQHPTELSEAQLHSPACLLST